VDLHRGRVAVESAGEGKGSTFSLELPLFRYPPGSGPQSMVERAERQAQHSPTRSREASPLPRRRALLPASRLAYMPRDRALRILAVDDSALNRKMLSHFLRPRCMLLHEAADGAEALLMFQGMVGSNTPYDVVVMDDQMPRVSGHEAAREMRRLGFCGVIIGVTGKDAEDGGDRFAAEGADVVLSKPVDVKMLEDLLERKNTSRRFTSKSSCSLSFLARSRSQR